MVLVAILVEGCGSSSSGSSGSSGDTEASTEFTKEGGNNRPATFGEVAGADEREAASQVLERNLKARASGDWAAQCATLTAGRIRAVEATGKSFGAGRGCVSSLKAQAEPLSQTKAFRVNTLIGPIDVLRVKGSIGYALYHGTQHKDYAMPMKKEDGGWKVARLATTEIP
jgi:hypothetical protein